MGSFDYVGLRVAQANSAQDDNEFSLLHIRPALDKLSRPGAPGELVSLHHNPPTRQHYIRHAGYFNSLKHRVIHPHMVRFRADGVLAIGIEDDDIRITANGNRALTR